MSTPLVPRPAWAPGMPALRPGDHVHRDGWLYTPELAQAIADAVAQDVSIHHQHAEAPDSIPPPTIVMGWRRQFPAFAVMLKHAEAVRADLIVEQARHVADHGQGAPPRIAIQVGVRMQMAERLDRTRWGREAPAPGQLPGADTPQPVAIELSDAELLSIASGGVAGEREPASVAAAAASE